MFRWDCFLIERKPQTPFCDHFERHELDLAQKELIVYTSCSFIRWTTYVLHAGAYCINHGFEILGWTFSSSISRSAAEETMRLTFQFRFAISRVGTRNHLWCLILTKNAGFRTMGGGKSEEGIQAYCSLKINAGPARGLKRLSSSVSLLILFSTISFSQVSIEAGSLIKRASWVNLVCIIYTSAVSDHSYFSAIFTSVFFLHVALSFTLRTCSFERQTSWYRSPRAARRFQLYFFINSFISIDFSSTLISF